MTSGELWPPGEEGNAHALGPQVCPAHGFWRRMQRAEPCRPAAYLASATQSISMSNGPNHPALQMKMRAGLYAAKSAPCPRGRSSHRRAAPARPHPEEARSAISKGGQRQGRLPILRDASLRDAPQDEVILLRASAMSGPGGPAVQQESLVEQRLIARSAAPGGPHPDETRSAVSKRGNDKAGCPSFETHRFAMLLRMR
jgi:hypothetical protein